MPHIALTTTYIPATPEDEAIVHNLSHVPFMAWLAECRDAIDYRAMLDAARHSAQYSEKFAAHLIRLDGPNGVRS